MNPAIIYALIGVVIGVGVYVLVLPIQRSAILLTVVVLWVFTYIYKFAL